MVRTLLPLYLRRFYGRYHRHRSSTYCSRSETRELAVTAKRRIKPYRADDEVVTEVKKSRKGRDIRDTDIGDCVRSARATCALSKPCGMKTSPVLCVYNLLWFVLVGMTTNGSKSMQYAVRLIRKVQRDLTRAFRSRTLWLRRCTTSIMSINHTLACGRDPDKNHACDHLQLLNSRLIPMPTITSRAQPTTSW